MNKHLVNWFSITRAKARVNVDIHVTVGKKMIDNEDVVKDNCYDSAKCREMAQGRQSHLSGQHIASYT